MPVNKIITKGKRYHGKVHLSVFCIPVPPSEEETTPTTLSGYPTSVRLTLVL